MQVVGIIAVAYKCKHNIIIEYEPIMLNDQKIQGGFECSKNKKCL